MRVKNLYKDIVVIVLSLMLISIILAATIKDANKTINERNKEIVLQPTYSIYEYSYENVIVFRYMEHKVIYEYAPEGIHLIQLIKGTEQITILEFENQERSIDFAYAYLEDIQREDRL